MVEHWRGDIRLFPPAIEKISQENSWSCNNPALLYWFHSVSETRLLCAINSELDASGKSPAYIHHRNNRARAGKLVAGFLNRTAATFSGRRILMQRIDARCVLIELPSEPLQLSTIAGQRVTLSRAKIIVRSCLISRHARTCRHAAWPRSRSHAAP
jgi:hypothetical protein